MVRARKGFTPRVKQVNSAVLVAHYLLHWENLAFQKLSRELNPVVDVIQIVNFIKSAALNSVLFSQMFSDMGSKYEHFLYYYQVSGCLKGK